MKEGKPIDRISGITRGDFFDRYFETEPVVLPGLIDHWPATTKWSPQYFADTYGDTQVWLDFYDPSSERSSLEHHLDWNLQQVPLRDYIATLDNEGQHYSLREDKELFEICPHIMTDLDFLVPFGNEETIEEDEYKGLWFGGRGHVTALHIDVGHGRLFHLYGEKRFTFFAPDQTKYLYEEDRKRIEQDERAKNVDEEELEIWKEFMRWSAVNPLKPNYEKFPLLKEAEYRVANIKSGDVIYVPDGWWHLVQSLTPTISITAGFDEELFLRAEHVESDEE